MGEDELALDFTDTGTSDGAKSSEGGVGCRIYPKDIKVNLVRVVPDN